MKETDCKKTSKIEYTIYEKSRSDEYRTKIRMKIYDKSACSITSTGVAVTEPHDPRPNLYLGGNSLKYKHKRGLVCSKEGYVLSRIEFSFYGSDLFSHPTYTDIVKMIFP